MSSVARWLKLGALVSSAGLLGLIAAELLLRLFWPQPLYTFERYMFQSDPELGFRLTPNGEGTHTQPDFSYIVRANSLGFRDAEPNPNAAQRVLVLGDSFGMGHGVAEGKNLCDLAQSGLSGRGHDIDIFNTSITAYFGGNQVAVLKQFAPEYRPDLVVLLFYWNDIGVTASKRIVDGHMVIAEGRPFIQLRRMILGRHSHLYCLVKRYHYALTKRPWEGVEHWLDPGTDTRSALGYISEMSQICRANEIEFRVVMLPFRGVLRDPGDRFRTMKAGMIRELDEEEIRHADWAVLLPADGARELAFRNDAHWNEAGHEFFSRALTDLILESLPISAPPTGAPSIEAASGPRSPSQR